jgi:hypothetical protein
MADGTNFDTSVLMRYTCLVLNSAVSADDDRLMKIGGGYDDIATLLENSDRQRVVGDKVEGEFVRACERHRDIYDDLQDWLRENRDASIHDYDITQRDVDYSPNDKKHFRFDVQAGWGDDDLQKQLSDFRRISQGIETVRDEILYNLLDEVYQQFSNDELKTELTDPSLDLDHDRDVIVDAVEINDRDGIDILVSADSDLADNESDINDRIERVESDDVVLRIRNPDDF